MDPTGIPSDSLQLVVRDPKKHRIQQIHRFQARRECPSTSSRREQSLLQQALNLWHHFASCAVVWCAACGKCCRGSLMDSHTSSAAPHRNFPWIWPFQGWRFYSWVSLCKGGMSVLCLWPEVTPHPKLSSCPFHYRGILYKTLWTVWTMASPTQTQPGMVLCWLWLSWGCIFFP